MNHLRFIVGMLTLMALVFGGIGGYLLLKGFQSGELFVGIVGSISGGIVGMISMRNSGSPPPPDQPVKTEVVNTTANPVPTDPQT